MEQLTTTLTRSDIFRLLDATWQTWGVEFSGADGEYHRTDLVHTLIDPALPLSKQGELVDLVHDWARQRDMQEA